MVDRNRCGRHRCRESRQRVRREEAVPLVRAECNFTSVTVATQSPDSATGCSELRLRKGPPHRPVPAARSLRQTTRYENSLLLEAIPRMLVITRAKLGMVGRGMDGELTTCPVGNTDTHIHRKDLEDTLVSKFPHISKASHYSSRSRAVPSGPERSRAVPSGPERSRRSRRSRAVPSGPERSRAVPSGPERSRAVPSGPEPSRAVPSVPSRPEPS
jgi:hypothetical protein